MFILITKCFCEECGKEFDNYQDASNHESTCFSLKKKQEVELKSACDRIFEGNNDLISTIDYKVNSFEEIVNFELIAEFKDGNKIIINDSLISVGKLIQTNDIIERFNFELNFLLPKEYEGVVLDNFGYGHLIGDTHSDTILTRLEGKKIRIQVIE
jgi:hypothetical protein